MMDESTDVHPAAIDLERLLGQCDVRRTRRRGPGGQHRNKVETAVVLVHRPTAIRAEASERRSQEENRRMALFRLRVKLALEVRRRLEVTDSFAPSAQWQSRCESGKIRVAAHHADYPTLLAEALDVIEAVDFDMTAAAAALGSSSSQLIKLLRSEPAALKQVNQVRIDRRLHPLS